MEGSFQCVFKRKKTRERFYSSMNYDQFYLLYGPPAPIFKPMQDPTQDLPPLELEQLENQQQDSIMNKSDQHEANPQKLQKQSNFQKNNQKQELENEKIPKLIGLNGLNRLNTILQIDQSQNQTNNQFFKSPRVDQFTQRRPFKQILKIKQLKQKQQQYVPKQARIRNRSQSDNSEYLIFNFLERATQNGRKKLKFQ